MIYERKNTLVITFVEQDVPKPSPYEIHEWIYEVFKFAEEELEMIQVNNYTRQVYIQCKESMTVTRAIEETNGESIFIHSTGQRSKVTITSAGLGFRFVKLYHLPKDLNPELIREKLATYGTVISLNMDMWGPTLRYKISNGVRTAKIDLKQHIPSYIDIMGYKSFVSYEGQPSTCALCNSTGHFRTECPKRRVITQTPRTADPPTWSQLVQGNFPIRREPVEGNQESDVNKEKFTQNAMASVSASAPSDGEIDVSACNTVAENTDTLPHVTASHSETWPPLPCSLMEEEQSEGESDASSYVQNDTAVPTGTTKRAELEKMECNVAISSRDPRVKKRRTNSTDDKRNSANRKKKEKLVASRSKKSDVDSV